MIDRNKGKRDKKGKRKERKIYYHSPIGIIEIVGNRDGLISITFAHRWRGQSPQPAGWVKECVYQLDEYFAGKRKRFSLPLHLEGTRFEKRVWRAVSLIPFGQTASYRDIAEAVGNKRATRAAGNANRANRFAIVIPCHRVIGSDGSLVGYGGGLWRKKWLLWHEQKHRWLSAEYRSCSYGKEKGSLSRD